MNIDYELYKIFYRVAGAGSFTHGAEELHITQSAISQAIKNLESRLGTALFVRDGRRIRLSREGEVLYYHIAQGVRSFQSGERSLGEMAGFDTGEVSIGVSDTVCRYHLVPLLKEFAEGYPGIRIQVKNRTSTGILALLQAGGIDFGIVSLPVAAAGVKVSRFRGVRDCFVTAPRFQELAGKSCALQKLVRYPLLLLNGESSTRRQLDRFFAAHDAAAVPAIELESVDLLAEFAKIGFGIAHVDASSVTAALENGELFEVVTDPPLPERELGIVTLGESLPSRAAALMRDFLAAAEKEKA